MAGSTGSVKTGRYTVLGPMRVWRGDTELTPGPPEQRALLALLALRAPGPVSVHEAVDVIGEGGPRTAPSMARTGTSAACGASWSRSWRRGPFRRPIQILTPALSSIG